MKIKFKTFIIGICLFCSLNYAYADTSIQEQLNLIENSIWGFSYNKENDLLRIERIEKQVFGTSNPKISPDKRVEKITRSLGLETYKEARSSLSDLYVSEKEGEGVEYPQIDRLEQVLLSTNYKKENITKRLERLEKKAFGAKQDGDLSQRTEALNRYLAANSPNNNPINSGNYYPSRNSSTNYSNPMNNTDVKLQIAALENMLFSTDFSQEPNELRLDRLENKIFQRSFKGDDDYTRISRIQAAASASKTAKYYDNNKFQKFAATGLQAASFLLMILAFIL